MERILLYVHFNKCNHISGHVFYQLEQLKLLFSKIIFISNSPLSNEDKCRLREDLGVSDLLERDNRGFDFAAWRDGMNWLGFDTLQNSDSLTLMNDTCFGPLWDLAPIYAARLSINRKPIPVVLREEKGLYRREFFL